MANQIKFVQDWNGKVTGGCKLFTTIRKSSDAKRKYYLERVGQDFEIILKGEFVGSATLRAVSGRKFSELAGFTLMVDTGYTDLESIKKLFKNFGVVGEDTVLILVFEKVG